MKTSLCICELIPAIDTKTRLCLIIQNRELKKPTNTGALAVKSLTNSEMHIRGKIDTPVDYNSLYDSSYENIFLYPGKNASPLTRELIDSFKKPVKLFVADGNWGQANRIYRRFLKAHSVQSIFLPVGKPTEYQLRKEHGKAEGLATIEAIARTMGIIENKETEESLYKIFKTMVHRTMQTRGIPKIATEKTMNENNL